MEADKALTSPFIVTGWLAKISQSCPRSLPPMKTVKTRVPIAQTRLGEGCGPEHSRKHVIKCAFWKYVVRELPSLIV